MPSIRKKNVLEVSTPYHNEIIGFSMKKRERGSASYIWFNTKASIKRGSGQGGRPTTAIPITARLSFLFNTKKKQRMASTSEDQAATETSCSELPKAIPTFTKSEQSKLYRASRVKAAELLTKVLHELDGWKFIQEKSDVKFFKKSSEDGKEYSINGITKVKASLDEVMAALYCVNNKSYSTLMSQLHDDKFTKGEVLADLAPRKDASGAFKERCGIKYMAFKPYSTLGKSRDYCVVDYCTVRRSSGKRKDANSGKEVSLDPKDRIGIQLYYSIARPEECPDNISGNERTLLTPSGYVVYPTSVPGVVEVIFCWSSVNTTNTAISRGHKKAILGTVQSICRLESALVALRVIDKGLIKPKNWVEDSERTSCVICTSSFSAFRRRHHCRICGDIICKKCSEIKVLKLPELGPSQVRICNKCVGTKKSSSTSSTSRKPKKAQPVNKKTAPVPSQEKPATNTTTTPSSKVLQDLSDNLVISPEKKKVVKNDDDLNEDTFFSIGSTSDFKSIPRMNRLDSEESSVEGVDDIYSHVKSTTKTSVAIEEEPDEICEEAEEATFNYPLDFSWKNHWPKAPVPSNDKQRVKALRALDVLDTDPEDEFNSMVKCAAQTFKTPFAFVSFIDTRREWIKASFGIKLPEVDRNMSFAAHALMTANKPTVVLDATDDVRFRDNPFVKKAPNLKFYLAYPLVTMDGGHVVGAIAVADVKARRSVDGDQIEVLKRLATHAMSLIEERNYSIATIDAGGVYAPQEAQMHNALASLLQKSYQTGMEVKKTQERMQGGGGGNSATTTTTPADAPFEL